MPRNRHTKAIDLAGIADPAHRDRLQAALNACDFPLSRIYRNYGKTVPVTVSDLSRYAAVRSSEDVNHGHSHINFDGEQGHLLGEPRKGALGLFWLPTPAAPAGRIEVGTAAFSEPHLAEEVLMAELAHAVDYGAMSKRQRDRILAAYVEGQPDADGVNDWFEEAGEDDYWAWIGESFMSGFMAAFAPSLPRPLEPRQPWVHRTTPETTAAVRKALRYRSRVPAPPA